MRRAHARRLRCHRCDRKLLDAPFGVQRARLARRLLAELGDLVRQPRHLAARGVPMHLALARRTHQLPARLSSWLPAPCCGRRRRSLPRPCGRSLRMRDRRALLISVRRAILRAALRAEEVLAMNADRNLLDCRLKNPTAARTPAASGLLIVSRCFAVNDRGFGRLSGPAVGSTAGVVAVDPGDRLVGPVGHALGHQRRRAPPGPGPSGRWNRVLFSQEPFWICVARGSRTVS